MRQVAILLLSIALFSCKAHKAKTTVTDSLTVSILPRDTMVILPADSALKVVQLKIVNGEITIGKTLAQYHGNKSMIPEIFVNDGILTVRSGTVQDTIHVTVYDTKERKAIHSTEVRYENILTRFQSFQVVAFWVFVGLIALRFIWKRIEKTYL